MNVAIHTGSKKLLNEALDGPCDGIIFGEEFCEWKIPTLDLLKTAYDEIKRANKKFTYITPTLSNVGVEKLHDHLSFLDSCGNIEIIIGDLGLLNIISGYKELSPRLGRSRVYIPARCPWDQITRVPNPSFLTSHNVEKLFYQTSLNYLRTLDVYRRLGIRHADVDWIPKVFPHYKSTIKNGFNLSVHTHTIPVAITMKCHMARFLNETDPSSCSKPCLPKALVIKQRDVQREYTLHGNVVFRHVEPSNREVKDLRRIGIDELVIPMGPVSGMFTKKDVYNVVSTLLDGV